MLTAEGCKSRRQRLWQLLETPPESDHLRFCDPIHLMYLAGFHVDPISLGAGFGGALLVRKDGHATLIHENRLPESVKEAHADSTRIVPWYDGQTPGQGPRQLSLVGRVNPEGTGLRFHDRPGDPYASILVPALAAMRRAKDPDELALLRRCMTATDAGHAWSRTNVKPGMTELDVYCGIQTACTKAAGKPVIVYGDFAVSPGPERRGGGPTSRVLVEGDMMILDYSVVIGGYRSDFTNTVVVGRAPNSEQKRIYDLCVAAIAAGERELCAGKPCITVYQAVRSAFEATGMAEFFPHHAGHGLGLTHPEAPFIVRAATEDLQAGDVITLEPGLYVPNVGGVRLEHNYLITATGFERLSGHTLEP